VPLASAVTAPRIDGATIGERRICRNSTPSPRTSSPRGRSPPMRLPAQRGPDASATINGESPRSMTSVTNGSGITR
jgi:hypothetical protein